MHNRTLAGVDPTDNYVDPNTKLVHDVDGQNQWPSIISGKASPRTLPTTHKSLLVDDGKGHMWKLINGNETRADRFHVNGSVYEDPHHACLPGHVNGSYGLQFDCINALGQGGGGGRMSCVVCSDDQPCLFDVLAVRPKTSSQRTAGRPDFSGLFLCVCRTPARLRTWPRPCRRSRRP